MCVEHTIGSCFIDVYMICATLVGWMLLTEPEGVVNTFTICIHSDTNASGDTTDLYHGRCL